VHDHRTHTQTGPACGTDRRAILEFSRAGDIVRVSAMDPATLTEVVIQGPASAGVAALERAALAKLAWVLGRRSRGGPAGRSV